MPYHRPSHEGLVMKPIAHIDDWIVVEGSSGTRYLVGRITYHERQPEFKSELQVTSPIVRMPGLGIVETINTIYTLGTARRLPL